MAPSDCLWLFFQVLHGVHQKKERNKSSTMKGGCLKTTTSFKINPQPTSNPQSSFTLLPDQNDQNTINLDPIKDSAPNVISLNIRSLTITDNSVKLKRIFKMA